MCIQQKSIRYFYVSYNLLLFSSKHAEQRFKSILQTYGTNKKITPNAGKDADKRNQSYIAGGNEKWYSHSGKYFGSSLKSKHTLIMQSRNDPLRHLSQRKHTFIPQCLCECSWWLYV